ncbi:hypothetical protein DM01DRAFT_1339736 [Hesseltinella vesiculosa]|uniref:Ubiquitin-like domain-containing protein n=1 Tax=Hesseltinella vesiculosa TaxID=101127 RepID=A0A1X2G673_9FUNG|nr:hypothetical protein DM01DRAFT_1339736 [Hesseltinella vesiculosa]
MAPPRKPMYIRVHRQKSIVFLCIEPKDTIKKIKGKLCSVTATEKTSDEVRLYVDTSKNDLASGKSSDFNPNTLRLLDDAQTAEAASLENNMTVYLVYFDSDKGEWENVQVMEFEALDADVDEEMADQLDEDFKKKEKGKGRA